MATSGVALSLLFSTPCKDWARVQLPVKPPAGSSSGSEDGQPAIQGAVALLPPVPEGLQHRRSVLQRVQSLSRDLPFVAWLTGGVDESIQIVCAKAVVARVFKLMHSQQEVVGVEVKDLKSHVTLAPMSGQELQQAASAALHAGLAGSGWWGMECATLLGANVLELADGRPHTCELLALEVEVQGSNALSLLVKPEVVRFRHLATTAPPEGPLDAVVGDLKRQLAGTYCRVLPDLRPGVISGVELTEGNAMAVLASFMAMHGVDLPAAALATPYLLLVDFDLEGSDEPSVPFHPCCVLSQSGFDPLHSRVDSPGVQAALARLRDDLTAASFPFFGRGTLKLLEARLWSSEGQHLAGRQAGPALQAAAFQSALQLEQAPPRSLALGPVVDLAGFSIPEGSGDGDADINQRTKKPHARAGPELATFLAKLAAEEQEQAAAADAAKKARAQAAPAVRASNKPPAGRPALPPGSKPAVPLKRKAAPAGGAAKKAPAAAKPAQPRKPKAAAAAQAAAAPGDGAVPGDAAAAAGPAAAAAPARPRAKAADVDIAEVTERVRALHAANSGLGALTIPQLKAYLKSVGRAVGGKKGELEERVRLHLSSEQ